MTWNAQTIAELAGAFGMGPRNAKAFAAKLISEIPRIKEVAPAASGVAAELTDERAAFEAWATEQTTYDLRPAKVKMLSIGGVPYDGYVRPYLQDRTVYTYQGFVAGVAAARAVLAKAAPVAVPTITNARITGGDVDGNRVTVNMDDVPCLALRTMSARCYIAPAAPVAAPLAKPSDEQVAAIEEKGRNDPTLHAFLRLMERDRLTWPDVLARMVLHLAAEKANLTARLMEAFSLTPRTFVIEAPVAAASEGWIVASGEMPKGDVQASMLYANGRRRTIIAFYTGKYEIECGCDDTTAYEINDQNDEFYLREGWYECIQNWGDFSSIAVTEGTVTHWQPLPAAPAEEAG